MDFTYLVTREIDERFCYIKYDTFELIMMKENNYVNATKLCELEKKDFNLWKRLDESKALIDEIKRINNIWNIKSAPSDLGKLEVIITVESESNSDKRYEVAGSYIHQDLLPYITSWISPSFAVKVSTIMNCYVSGKYEFKLKEKEEEIKKRENKIDELMGLLYKFSGKYDRDTTKLEKYNKQMEDKYDRDITEAKERYREQRKEAKELKEYNKKLSNSVKRVERKYNKDTNELKSELREIKTELKKLEECLKYKMINIPSPKIHRLMISKNDKDSNILKLYDYKPKA
ncbi:KilA N domain protein [Finch poxvirus]|uniref:KilA N domain protein n=2 Tax=unclassified Avipoxvirus TaxID=336487 RepID=A0AAT9UR32_9POXV|nr:KilA N domain protein [Finch poxvirus]UOX38982.1 KilA N domain protein [Finch poxvirus]